MSNNNVSDKDISVIDNNTLDLSEISNKVNAMIDIYTSDNDISDISKISQLQFNSLCMYIGYNYFKPLNILRMDIHNSKSNYNYDKIYNIIPIFVNICNKYNKVFTIHAYMYFLGIDYGTYIQWISGINGNSVIHNDKLTYSSNDVIKILNRLNELSLSDNLLKYNNPVGNITILNHNHNWQSQEIAKGRAVQEMSLDDIGKQIGIDMTDMSDN